MDRLPPEFIQINVPVLGGGGILFPKSGKMSCPSLEKDHKVTLLVYLYMRVSPHVILMGTPRTPKHFYNEAKVKGWECELRLSKSKLCLNSSKNILKTKKAK